MNDNLHDTNANFRQRNVLGFFLFIFLGLLTVAICGKSVAFNNDKITDCFSSYSCSSSFREDILTYTEDVFTQNGLNTDNLDEIITQEEAQNITEMFAQSKFGSKLGITDETVSEAVEALSLNIKSEIESQLEELGIKDSGEAVDLMTSQISEYITNHLDLPGASYIESILNIAGIVFIVLMIVSAVSALVFLLMIYFVGAKRYRSVRAIASSFAAAGITDLIVSLIAVITLKIKTVDISPQYIKIAFDAYTGKAITCVAVCGLCMLFMSLILLVWSWTLKRKTR